MRWDSSPEANSAAPLLTDPAGKVSWSVTHPLSEEDAAGAAALRLVVARMKVKFEGTAGRGPFNDTMERVAVPEDVTFEAPVPSDYSGCVGCPLILEQRPL